MSSNRELILENLKGVLENITTANGFNNDVSKVERMMLTADNPSITAFPVLMVLGGSEVFEDQLSNYTVSTLRVKIRGYSKNEQDPEGFMNSIIQDVLRVLEDSTYNSTYHNKYRPLSVDTDEGWINTDTAGLGFFEIAIEIRYRFLRTSP